MVAFGQRQGTIAACGHAHAFSSSDRNLVGNAEMKWHGLPVDSHEALVAAVGVLAERYRLSGGKTCELGDSNGK